MNTAMMAISCLCTFLTGFAAGLLWGPRPKAQAEVCEKVVESELLKQLRQEYHNFLSYDGSEQL